MKRRGFTLIEIIVSIAIIALIGVGSFVGINYINNQIVISRLNQITDKALNAAQVYIETNDVAYNEVYNNKSVAIIPLKTLVNEGLLNVDNTKLDDQDMEKNYVIQYLGGGGAGGSNCTDLSTIITSWNSTTPIYICNDGAGGGINIKTIDKSEYNNKMYSSSNEPYYFRGSLVRNYAKIDGNNTLYRMVSIDTNDSIELFHASFDAFSTLDSSYYYAGSYSRGYNSAYNCSWTINGCVNSYLGSTSSLIMKSSICESSNTAATSYGQYGGDHTIAAIISYNSWYIGSGTFDTSYKNASVDCRISTITLKPCMQIKSGSGTEYDPYIIKPNNC